MGRLQQRPQTTNHGKCQWRASPRITLSHRITSFTNVTTRQMLTHLHTTHGRLSPIDVQENDARMKTPCNPSQPIETFIDQIEDGVALADAASTACTTAQIIAIACNLIFATGAFPKACVMTGNATSQRTENLDELHFSLADQECRDSQVTSQQAGHQQAANPAHADLQQDTTEAIASLATATAAENLPGTKTTPLEPTTWVAAKTRKRRRMMAPEQESQQQQIKFN